MCFCHRRIGGTWNQTVQVQNVRNRRFSLQSAGQLWEGVSGCEDGCVGLISVLSGCTTGHHKGSW